MNKAQTTPGVDADAEYRSIEATLLATARGRWFLAEHGRRARRLDNALLEDAVSRLSASLKEPTALAERLKSQLNSVRDAIRDATTTVASRKRHARATTEPLEPAALAGSMRPTLAQSLLQASEQVHELAWTLQGREGRDFDHRTLEQIGRQVIAIYALARQQAADLEYTEELLGLLAIAEERVSSLLETVDHELHADRGPQPPPDRT